MQAGAASGHLTAAGAGTFALSTQYWRVPTEPLAEHTLRVWIYANDLALSEASVTLKFVDASGAAVGLPGTVQLAGQAAEWRLATIGPVVAPAGTAFARVVVRGTAAASGATLHVDSATLEQGAPPSPTATATSTSTATATTTATSTATTTATTTATPTKTATPRPGPLVFDVLVNGGFEFPDGLFGWRTRGGTPLVIGGLPDATQAALLLSETSSTKWLYQTLRVEPGRWYVAGARLRPQPGVSSSWLRIAWYASDDGSGSQLSTDDSDEVPGPQPRLVAVEAGPIQAPLQARSAQVRLMLRPAGPSVASLIVDDVFFVEVDAPTSTPSPTPTPTESAAATATASETPSPIVAAGAPGSPGPGVPPSEHDEGVAREAAPEILLRITELLPNPIAPGPDADFK